MKPLNAGRAQKSFCDEFLASHSDYLDGLMPPLQAARMSAHADSCAACGRYDRVVRKGVVLAREIPEVPLSGDFEMRLHQRLLSIEAARSVSTRPAAGGVVATLGVAAAIAVLAWSPLLTDRGAQQSVTAEPAQETEAPAYAGLGAMPLIVDDAWYPVAAPAAPPHDAAAVLATFPGPYSPLIVTPPVHRTVRTVSSEYLPVE